MDEDQQTLDHALLEQLQGDGGEENEPSTGNGNDNGNGNGNAGNAGNDNINDNDSDNNNDAHAHEVNYSISFAEYCKNAYFLAELIFCVAVAMFGVSPHIHIIDFLVPLNEREIPYQKTNDGEDITIVRDLYLDREYIAKESVPTWLGGVLCILMPLLTMIAFTLFFGAPGPRTRTRTGMVDDIHSIICAFLFAAGCTSFITDWVKNYVGYWRPNFYNYCVRSSSPPPQK